MKKIDIGQTAGILANVGVLVGILLLVYELNQNRQMMLAQTRNDVAETLVNITLQQAGNRTLAEVTAKALSGESLDPAETRQWLSQMQAIWRYRENVSYQYRNGLFEESEYLSQREAWRRSLRLAPIREFWCGREDIQSPQFVAEMDKLLETPCD